MKNYFRYMAGNASRWIRGIVGLTLAGIGYSSYTYPVNLILIVLGLVILLAAIFNVLILAHLFGYSINGNSISRKYGTRDEVPGEDLSGSRGPSEKNKDEKHPFGTA